MYVPGSFGFIGEIVYSGELKETKGGKLEMCTTRSSSILKSTGRVKLIVWPSIRSNCFGRFLVNFGSKKTMRPKV